MKLRENNSMSSLFKYENHCGENLRIRSFFFFVFSRIWMEYGNLLYKRPYSDGIKGKYGTEKKIGHFSRKEYQKPKTPKPTRRLPAQS